MSFKVISMFSGAGGLDMGFHNEGFQVLWANDFNKDACDTYDLWANYHPDGTRKDESECTVVSCGDISKVDFKKEVPGKKREVDVVLGGFPCQGFSLAGPRQVDDSRNVLYRHFVEMVREKEPKILVAENVIGITTLGGGVVFEKIIEDFNVLGYTMSAHLVNAKNYGVPQDRMRVIFVGIREDISKGGAFQQPAVISRTVTLRDALANLPPVDMDDVCQAPFSSRYMSRNRKRDYGDVSFTIPAMAKQVALSPDSEGMEYVDVDQFRFIGTYNRRLSYKEAAAIQTFPPDMEFKGDLDSKYKQIGNAVPVKLAEAIAAKVKEVLTAEDLHQVLNYAKPEEEIHKDLRITSQVLNGKAFEYAVLTSLRSELLRRGWAGGQLRVIEDKNWGNILNAYQMAVREDDEEGHEDADEIMQPQNDFVRAAKAAAVYICDKEPILCNPTGLCAEFLSLPDTAGIEGDVRDIKIIVNDADKTIREIGISCKNNHEAVKNPRITEYPDFAQSWGLGVNCTPAFMKEMGRIQERIENYAKQYKRWSEIDNKGKEIYGPIIKAFTAEIKRLGVVKESDSKAKRERAHLFARNFFQYMFGKYDFYKVIKEDKSSTTKVYPYNMNGTLMKAYQGQKNKGVSRGADMPDEIVEVRVKPGSENTLEVFFDKWIITMRIHNADARIRKTALKFDVQIKAQPRKIMPIQLEWNKL